MCTQVQVDEAVYMIVNMMLLLLWHMMSHRTSVQTLKSIQGHTQVLKCLLRGFAGRSLEPGKETTRPTCEVTGQIKH